MGFSNTNKSNKIQRNLEYTYIVPPPAGPIALNRDIAVIEIPLAAPLWCCSYHSFKVEFTVNILCGLSLSQER